MGKLFLNFAATMALGLFSLQPVFATAQEIEIDSLFEMDIYEVAELAYMEDVKEDLANVDADYIQVEGGKIQITTGKFIPDEISSNQE